MDRIKLLVTAASLNCRYNVNIQLCFTVSPFILARQIFVPQTATEQGCGPLAAHQLKKWLTSHSGCEELHLRFFV